MQGANNSDHDCIKTKDCSISVRKSTCIVYLAIQASQKLK